jgi:OmpA-OmpF porin, OOP family
MKSKITLLCAAAAVVALATSTAARAEGYLPEGGYLLPQISSFSADKNAKDLGNGLGFGLRYGMPIWGDFDLQFGINHATAKSGGDKVQQTLFGADALYLFSRDELRPFVSLGLGLKRDSAQIGGGAKTNGNAPFLSAGAGVQWMFSEELALQADYRRVQGKNKAFEGTGNTGNNYFNLGLMWSFDKPAAAAPVVAEPVKPVYVPPPAPVVAPEPAPAPVVEPAPAPQRITLAASSLFAINSATISTAVSELDALATALKANPQVSSVVITGHTDQLGKEAVNRRLSQERAEAVKTYLVGKGVDANRLVAKGMASSQLVTNCKLPTRAEMIKCGTANRRVVIEPITVTKP